MKVLHIHEQFEERGGTEKHISRLRKIFEKNRFGTRLLVVRPEGSNHFYWAEDEAISSASVEPFIRLDQKLNSILKGYKPDAILVHGITFPKFINKLLQKANCPVLRYMHEPRMVCPGHSKFWHKSEVICQKPVGIHCFFHAYTEMCAPRNPKRLVSEFKNTQFEISVGAQYYTRVIVASDYMQKQAELVGVASEKIVKISPPLDTEPLPFEYIPIGAPRILFVGRMSRTKGPHILLRMLAPLLIKNAEWQLDLVGDGLMKSDCVELAAQYGIAHQTHFHGWKVNAELEALYKRCSVVVFPTIYPEAFGGVGLEAFRCGRAVVGFDVGGVSEWLRDRVNGRLVEPGDEAGFSNAVAELLSNTAALNEIGKAAQKLVYDRFGSEVLFEKYRKIFSENCA